MITKVKYSDRNLNTKTNNISLKKTHPYKDITEKILKDYSDSIKFDETLNRYIIHKDIEIDNIRYEPIRWYFDKDVELKESVTIKPKKSCNGFFLYINGDFYWYGCIDLTNRGGKLDKRPPMIINWETMEIKTNSAFVKDRRLDFNDNYDFHYGGDNLQNHWTSLYKGEPGSIFGGGSGATGGGNATRYSGKGGPWSGWSWSAGAWGAKYEGAGNWDDESLSYHGVGGSLFLKSKKLLINKNGFVFKADGLKGGNTYYAGGGAVYGPGGGSGGGYIFILVEKNEIFLVDNNQIKIINYTAPSFFSYVGGEFGTQNNAILTNVKKTSHDGSYVIMNSKTNQILSNDYHATLDIEFNK